MQKTRNVRTRLATPVAALAFALVAGACAPDMSSTSANGDGGLTGAIKVSGSSTVEPISGAVAEKFAAENPGVQLSVDGPGTGDGFELFCSGDTDISNASRPIDPEEEIPACEEAGIEFIELKVAIDGITVLTSPDNTAVDCLSFPDLYALLGIESEGFASWSDANGLAKEVGGSGDYPDAPLDITAPGEESGTYDSFVEIVLEDIAAEHGVSEDGPFVRPDYQASGDDNVIIEGIAGSKSSLGWVGYAFYEENTDAVRALPISAEEGGDCVEPNSETISSGEYPIARDLYIYVNAAKAEQNPALQAYVDLYLSDAGIESVTQAGYVALHSEDLAATRAAWEERKTGV
jgi:phosphate transport system substrate-binding protein